MKRLLLFLIAAVAILYGVETIGAFGLNGYKPQLQGTLLDKGYSLSWTGVAYPACYEVEILTVRPTSDRTAAPEFDRIATYRTWGTSLTIPENYPYRTFWRVSARGLFRQPLGFFSDCLRLSKTMGFLPNNARQVRPGALSTTGPNAPYSDRPFLIWSVVPGAVFYEIEFLSQPPENPNDTEPSQYRVGFSREVYTNGYNADLSAYAGNRVLWRVRALDYDGNPLGVFSDTAELFLDHTQKTTLKPLLTVEFNRNGVATPLYPAYSWIPIAGAASYEVEVLSAAPETANNQTASPHRIWSKQVTGFDCYDEEPRLAPGTYYWRVVGLDTNGNPVGVYSDAGKFEVNHTKGAYACTFGDSITHGGGAVSYSPADWPYSYQTYLDFPVVNLGKSGDTSEGMAERFDRDVLPFKPKYLIILGGTNSLRGGTPASQVISDLTVIRDKALAAGIRPIFLTLPPINPDAIWKVFSEATAENWREEFDKVNAFIRLQPYYIDLEPQFCDTRRRLPDSFAVDGLHPDIEAKRLIARIINANWQRVTR